jgi:hypothetical protein
MKTHVFFEKHIQAILFAVVGKQLDSSLSFRNEIIHKMA